MFDATAFSDHWVDVVLTALLASIGWFIIDRLRSMDERHKRAEDKFEEIERELAGVRERLAFCEAQNGRISSK